jgi:HSP20 family protein
MALRLFYNDLVRPRYAFDNFFDDDDDLIMYDAFRPYSILAKKRNRSSEGDNTASAAAAAAADANNTSNKGEQEKLTSSKPAAASAADAWPLLTPRNFHTLDKKAVHNMMSTDLIESDQEYQVHVDLPGVDPADLDVTIEENKYLVLKAERKHVHEEKTDKVHSMERSFGTVQRKIRLPVNADLQAIQTTFKQGVLTIKMGKKPMVEEEKVRKLQIMTE